MLSIDLVAELMQRRDNEVEVEVAHPSILVYVQNVTRYPTLTQLLDHEDPAAIAGAGATRADVTALLNEIYSEPLTAYLAIEVSLLSPVSQPRPPTAVDATGIAVIAD